MINIVTIDPSINSTGITINGEVFAISSESIAYTKSLKNYKRWYELSSEHATIETVDTSYQNQKIYSKLEIIKLETYQRIANLVRTLVDKHCKSNYNTLVLIEGYSYSSQAGPLIDLVTLSTLVRRNLFSRTDTELVVVAPTSLKKLAGKLTYAPIVKGKKTEYRNPQGKASGSFNKHDMYMALIENSDIQTDWVTFLREHSEEILLAKAIPKPIEDINDAIMMYHVALMALTEHVEFLETVDQLRKA